MERVIKIATNEVGYVEKASKNDLYSTTGNPGSANYTKYAKDMSVYSAGIFANGYAWCDTFVDWCFTKAYGSEKALLLIHGWSAYTPTSAGYFKNHGQWHTTPKKGDVVFFKDSQGTICHTGIVCSVDGGYITTVEGNTSTGSGVVANGGGVAKKKYSASYNRIAGYGRPDYSLVKEEPERSKDGMYNKIEDCPLWAQPYVKAAVNSGYVKGTPDGKLNLDDTKIWCLVVMLRISGIMQ